MLVGWVEFDGAATWSVAATCRLPSEASAENASLVELVEPEVGDLPVLVQDDDAMAEADQLEQLEPTISTAAPPAARSLIVR